MQFKKIFVETSVQDHEQTARILAAFPHVPVIPIDKIETVFEKTRKPYLQKRTSLNLFIGRKAGQLVKEAPDAYGLDGVPHYYFIHAYNCIYECEYCYLQGYFKSPDLVWFVNHDEIIAEIRRLAAAHADAPQVWFHAGEFSDSLALSHLSGELPQYWEAFADMPRARLELRTKSVNVRPLLALKPLDNIIITFSMSPPESARRYDRQTPGTASRLKAIGKLAKAGFRMGIHCDPMIFSDTFVSDYARLIDDILAEVPAAQIEYVSLGVVRFTRDVFLELQRNYPQSPLLVEDYAKSFDNKIRYSRPQRLFMLKTVRQQWVAAGLSPERVYLCMENEWQPADGEASEIE